MCVCHMDLSLPRPPPRKQTQWDMKTKAADTAGTEPGLRPAVGATGWASAGRTGERTHAGHHVGDPEDYKHSPQTRPRCLLADGNVGKDPAV